MLKLKYVEKLHDYPEHSWVLGNIYIFVFFSKIKGFSPAVFSGSNNFSTNTNTNLIITSSDINKNAYAIFVWQNSTTEKSNL